MDQCHMCNTNSDNFHISPVVCDSLFISWLLQQLSRSGGIIPLVCMNVEQIDARLILIQKKGLDWGDYFACPKMYYSWLHNYHYRVEMNVRRYLCSNSSFCKFISTNAHKVPKARRSLISACQSLLCLESPRFI